MNKWIIYITALFYCPSVFAEYRAEFSSYTVSIPKTLYVPKNTPINTLLATVDLGTFTPWVWWNEQGITRVGINLPGIFDDHYSISGVGAIKEIGDSGIGFALHGVVNSPCSGRGYVNGRNQRDGNPANRLLCPSTLSTSHYNISLKVAFYKVRPQVKTQWLPSTKAAMLILFNDKFIAQDSYGNFEPTIWLSPINVISNGCEVKNSLISVSLNKVEKSAFKGVGTTSSDGRKRFKIELECDAGSAIKITFIGNQDLSGIAGTIALNNRSHRETAKGFGIQIKHKGKPIKLNQKMLITRSNQTVQYSIPLEAAYVQTEQTTRAGKAEGTLQFNLQYE